MARKLTRKQKDYIERISAVDKYILGEEEVKHLEDIHYYESMQTDAERMLSDLMFKKRHEAGSMFGIKGSF